MSSSSLAFQLLAVAQNYTLYSTYILFVAGLIGNTLSILVFTKVKVFRGNRCSFYLIAESIAGNFFLCLIVIPQILQGMYGTDPANLSLIWCKIRTTFLQPTRLTIAYIVCFEALDQYLSTNHRFYLRQISTLKLARRLVGTSYGLFVFQSIPYIVFYDIVVSSGCIITNQVLIYYYSYFYYPILHGAMPILISSLFSLLAYRNVRHLVRRQIPIERRKLDRQMTAMIFVRVINFVLLSLPYTVFRIYVLNVSVTRRDALPYAINQLTAAIISSLLIWIYSCNFYLFLLTSTRFRRQVKYVLMKKCWQTMKQCCRSNHNEVYPLNTASVGSSLEIES